MTLNDRFAQMARLANSTRSASEADSTLAYARTKDIGFARSVDRLNHATAGE
jgi:hypothetical protein